MMADSTAQSVFRKESFRGIISSAVQKVASAAGTTIASAPPTTAFYSNATVKSGWLKKQGGIIKNWNRRWFALKGEHLFYFTDNTEAKLMGTISLTGNRVVEVPFNPEEADKFLFEILPGQDKDRMSVTHETYPICADSDDERKAWIQALRCVIYAHKGGGMFGKSLQDTMQFESRSNSNRVPEILQKCVLYIQEHGMDVEGIFRHPGRQIIVRELRESFDCGEKPSFSEDVDVHSVASLMKAFLRQLPAPLVPFDFYEAVMKIGSRELQQNPEAAIDNLKEVIANMPHCNYNVLKYVCHFLNEVSQNHETNKMTAMNLATVFVPSIIKPEVDDAALLMGTAGARTQVVFVLISEWERIFQQDYFNAQGQAAVVGDLLGDLGNHDGDVTEFRATTNNIVPDARVSELLDLDFAAAPVLSPLAEPLPPQIPPRFSLQETSPKRNGTVIGIPGNSDVMDCSDRKPEVRLRRAQTERPVPLPRKNKNRVYNSASCDSIETVDSALGAEEELNIPLDQDLDLLLEQVDNMPRDDLEDKVRVLCAELRKQRGELRDISTRYLQLKRHLMTTVHKIGAEKLATSDAVDRVVQLQAQLQEYTLRYGKIHH